MTEEPFDLIGGEALVDCIGLAFGDRSLCEFRTAEWVPSQNGLSWPCCPLESSALGPALLAAVCVLNGIEVPAAIAPFVRN